MNAKRRKQRIFVSVNDPSADVHCGALIRALKERHPDLTFVGIGGPKMTAAGCELIEETVGKAVMTYKALAHVGHFYKLIKHVKSYLKAEPVDLVIVCDSPAFNFHIAKGAKKAGVPVLFYVAPQLWAWGAWRIGKLRRCCDKLCCLLPFEESWFGSRGVDTTFVGNPLLDKMPEDLSTFRKDYSDFNPSRARIGLMPGSRATEIELLWPAMQAIAVRLQETYPGACFVAVAASEDRRALLEKMHVDGFKCEYAVDSVTHTASEVDFTFVASGSATLEVASAGCPMVVMYQTNRILWHLLGRWLVRSKFLALVNVLADRRVVPEFMPYFTSVDPIVAQAQALLADPEALGRISNELVDLTQPLTGKRAAPEVARIALEMLT